MTTFDHLYDTLSQAALIGLPELAETERVWGMRLRLPRERRRALDAYLHVPTQLALPLEAN